MTKTSRYLLGAVVALLSTATIIVPPYSAAQPSGEIVQQQPGGQPGQGEQPAAGPQSLPPYPTLPVPRPTGSGGVQFEDVTAKAGLNTTGEQWGDIAVGDYDNSGWDSVYIGHHGTCNTRIGLPCTIAGPEGALTWPRGGQLFHNNRDGTFTEVTDLLPPVTDMTQHRHFALWCDIESTGYEDLIIGTGFRDDVTDVTGVNDLWLRNNNGTSFTDMAPQLGTTDLLSKVATMTCANLVGATVRKTASARPPMNGPDVLLANNPPSPALGAVLSTHLWVNYGSVFSEEAAQRGLTHTTEYRSSTGPYGMACADFRRIGTMDCLVTGTNYSFWFLSNGNGTFQWTTGAYRTDIAALPAYLHDAYFADFRGSGLLDAAIANTTVQLQILCNNGTSIVGSPCAVWAPPPLPNAEVRAMAVGDFDNSGVPSIFLTVSGGCVKDGNGCKGPDYLLMNDGHLNFTDVATQAGLNQFVGIRYGSGGAAVIDYDMDGRLDLIVGYNEIGTPGPFRVYRNVTQNDNGWIGFRLKGPLTLGSWVMITACGKRQVQQVTARTGWVHQSSRVLHFGLGRCTDPVVVDTVWHTGQVTRFSLAANHYYTMTATGQPQPLR